MDTNDPNEPDDQNETPEAPASPPGTAVTDSMKSERPQTGASFVRRHAVGVAVAAAVLAVVVVAGGTAWGVSAAVAAADTAAPAALSTAMHGTKGGAAGGHRHVRGVVGTLTAMSGDTWTVHSAAGATVTVAIGSTTEYGTAKKPATASSFAVGDRVGVIGARSGDTVKAARIVHLAAAAHPHTGTPGSAPTPGASS